MAVYNNAFCLEKAREMCRVLRSENRDSYTAYIIEINLTPYKWQVERRYKQFVELHEKMVIQFSISKTLLPPKKVFRNRSESFILERQHALEHYLQTLIQTFSLLPEPLAYFLDFKKYEVRYITASLSEMLFLKGDEIISDETPFKFNPMQLYAFSERLKLGDPTCYSNNPQQDIAHLVEFITQLKHLKILGSHEYLEASNIVPNNLPFELSMFKSLDTLEIINCKLKKKLLSVETIRPRLKKIIVNASLSDLSDLLLCEILHWCPVTDPVRNWPFWNSITYANFSHNSFTKIHPCIKLLPSARHIDLSYNDIQVLENLETLSELSELNLSNNKIKDLESLHTRLGNIDSLNLSSNRIKSLHGLSKLFSVSKLFLENNYVSSICEISHLSRLPCLEVLNLQNNPVTFIVDYRPQLLLTFDSLASEIVFDGLKATDKEIDTVSVLQALKQARGKSAANSDEIESASGRAKLCCNKFTYPETSHEASTSENASTKGTKPLIDASKFRQQIEILRKKGGSDWLRLLNEMKCLSYKATAEQNPCKDNVQSSSDIQFNIPTTMDKNLLAPQLIKSFTSSYELSFPDWLLFLDLNNLDFQQSLIQAYQENKTDISESSMLSEKMTDAKIVWAVILNCAENTINEIPVCILFLPGEITFYKLKEFRANKSQCNVVNMFNFYPVFMLERSFTPSNILSVSLGTCDAYVEFKVKSRNKTETIIIAPTNKLAANAFVNECQHLYEIDFLFKTNPFINKSFDMENMSALASLCNLSIEKQIIFCQRVSVSKAFHESRHGVLHFVFVTPSHVILVEERLLFTEISGLDTNYQPQFQICALVSVHTNIKQVHLQDTDIEPNNELSSTTELTQTTDNTQFKDLSLLYQCGSWLIMEFESSVIFYLNFFNLKFRSEFLNAFLCARSQK